MYQIIVILYNGNYNSIVLQLQTEPRVYYPPDELNFIYPNAVHNLTYIQEFQAFLISFNNCVANISLKSGPMDSILANFQSDGNEITCKMEFNATLTKSEAITPYYRFVLMNSVWSLLCIIEIIVIRNILIRIIMSPEYSHRYSQTMCLIRTSINNCGLILSVDMVSRWSLPFHMLCMLIPPLMLSVFENVMMMILWRGANRRLMNYVVH